MKVRLNGGPLNGQTLEFPQEQVDRGVLYWPVGSERHPADEDDVPGVDNVVEYIYRGDGSADYVGGLLDDEAALED
jgi:hypothetical protein